MRETTPLPPKKKKTLQKHGYLKETSKNPYIISELAT